MICTGQREILLVRDDKASVASDITMDILYCFEPRIKDHIKSIAGSRWHPEERKWSLPFSAKHLLESKIAAHCNDWTLKVHAGPCAGLFAITFPLGS